MRLLVEERWFHLLLAIACGLLLAVAILETLFLHETVTDATVTQVEERGLLGVGYGLAYEVYDVRLSYDWRLPSAHGTCAHIGSRLAAGNEFRGRVGSFTGLILNVSGDAGRRYLVFEPSFGLALLSYLVYWLRIGRHWAVLLVPAGLQGYLVLWLGHATLMAVAA